MRMKTCLSGLVSCIVAISAVGGASAAGAHASVATQQKVVAGYRLMLEVGPVQKMGEMAEMGGAMTVGGKPATCRMPGKAVTGGMPRNAKTCNRHISVHVFDARTNKIQIKAHVTITMLDTKKHVTISVPIMMMMGSAGLRDFQYGKNVAAAPGAYTVSVKVNSAHTTFAVTLK